MKDEFGYAGWLGEEDYLCCIFVAREAFFRAPHRLNIVQMAAACADVPKSKIIDYIRDFLIKI